LVAVEAAAVVLGILELVVVVEPVLVLEEVHLHQPLIQILVDKVATMVVMEAAVAVLVAELLPEEVAVAQEMIKPVQVGVEKVVVRGIVLTSLTLFLQEEVIVVMGMQMWIGSIQSQLQDQLPQQDKKQFIQQPIKIPQFLDKEQIL